MGKIAFVFAGQGGQYSGMGKSLYEGGGAPAALYDRAELLRPGTMAQSFTGSEEELKRTLNTQPCLYLVDLAAALALEDAGISADGVAGFSLGEVAALAYAGAYSPMDGFELVSTRCVLMDAASDPENTGMQAVLKLDSRTVAETAARFEELYAVNFNSPGQTVVSGKKSSFPAFEAAIKALGGRCVPLAVSGAFHSPWMNQAAEKFGEVLRRFAITPPRLPVYANLTGLPYGENVAETLQMQMKNPVQWQTTIETMAADRFDTFIEVGAGKTLSGLIRKIDPSLRVYSVEDADSLARTVKAVKENA